MKAHGLTVSRSHSLAVRTLCATVRLCICAALLLSVACTDPPPPPAKKITEISDFALVDHDGRAFRHASLQGRPALLFFGYTHCPDACPITMSKVARAYRLAGPDAKKIPTLFVSVDPRDTPPVLRQYVSYFSAVPAKGLTGTKEQIDAVVKQFGAKFFIRDSTSAAGPLVDHTLWLYLLDREGDVIARFDPQAKAEEIARAMKAAM